MKKQTVNTFDGGMVLDVDELHTKSNTLSYARNTEYLTTEGNQLILQKRKGRSVKINVTSGFNIKAVKVIDDVAYIISTRVPKINNGTAISTSSDVSLDQRALNNVWSAFGQVYDVSSFSDLRVTNVDIDLKVQSAVFSGTVKAKLFSVVNGIPGTLLATSDSFDLSTISTSFSYKTFTFPGEINVSAYDKVAVSIELVGPNVDLQIQLSEDPAAYHSGSMFYGKADGAMYTFDFPGAIRSNLVGIYTTTGESELGTFPSPVYPETVSDDTIVQMSENYSPLYNFSETQSNIDEDYNNPFRTTELNIKPDSEVNLELQKTYDGSVNMIFSSNDNPVRLINTKFKVNNDSTATLIKRRLNKNDNVYSNEEFHKTELIPRPTTIGRIDSVNVRDGGSLPAGGYRYYIKYITADGIETDIIEESRTIDIHYSSNILSATGGKPGELIPKLVNINMANLDTSFKGVRVYFSVSAGSTAVSTKMFGIINTFDINSNGTITIIHTGYEATTEVDPIEFSINYSQIKNSSLITKVNNRLILSGSTTSLNHKEGYSELATYLQIRDESSTSKISCPIDIDVDEDLNTHANPNSFYELGEYWDAETYEIGVVFITKDGETPVYPIQGLDRMDTAINIPPPYDANRLGDPNNGFGQNGQNPYGVFRTRRADRFFSVHGDRMAFTTVHLYVFTGDFVTELYKYPEILGYYFVRKQRKKDVLMRGLLTPTVAIPQVTTFGKDNIIKIPPFTNGGRPGVDSILDGGYKRVPIPDLIMPYAVGEVEDSNPFRLVDFQLRAPVSEIGYDAVSSSHAFYSPDIDCNVTSAASMFSSRDFGVHVYKPTGLSSTAYKDLNVGSNYNKAGLYTYNKWTGPSVPGFSLDFSSRNSGNLMYVNENTLGAGAGSFAGSTDRNLWVWGFNHALINKLTNSIITNLSNDYWSIGDLYNHSVDDDKSDFGSNALKYGRYVGMKIKYLTDSTLSSMHMSKRTTTSTGKATFNINIDYTPAEDGTALASQNDPFFIPNTTVGYLCSVYSGSLSEPIPQNIWTEKYQIDNNEKFFAVSKRYEVSQVAQLVPLGDGDCYSGLMWKRVFRPRGIDEAPQATDTKAYEESSRDVGMADFGYAISIPSKSNYNFHLRVPDSKDEGEYNLFGQKRSFLPVQGKENIRGAKLDETSEFNQGYGASSESVVSRFKLNPDSPYYKSEQPNRIYASDTDIESNFVNGFTQFKGLSYRDYNSELGPIRNMVSFNGRIVAVFDTGVATIGVDERSMIPGSEGDIFMDSAKALASKSEVKSTIIGSDQPTSIVVTSSFVYGVDTKQYKIWRTDGKTFKTISDLKVQSWLKEVISELGSSNSDTKFTVYTTYDSRKSELLFTFTKFNITDGELIGTKTIAYNELLEIWVCETDEHCSNMFYIDEYKYSARPNFENSIYVYNDIELSNLLNLEPVEKTIIEFIVNKDQNEIKVLENMIVVGNSVLPTKLEFTSDIYKGRSGIPPLLQYVNSRTPVYVNILNDINISNLGMYSLRFDGNGLLGVTNPTTGLPIAVGDLVTLVSSIGNEIKTKIISVTPDGKDVSFSDPVPEETSISIYLGHRNDIRHFNTELHEGITYIIPSCLLNSKITQPRGKWIKIRIELTGADKMYISGIASVYNQSLS